MSLGAACLMSWACATASITVTPIALSGHDDNLGPGEGSGIHFGTGVNGDLSSATNCINGAGDVIFRCADDESTPMEGVWLHSASSNANTLLATSGGTAGVFTYGNSGFNFPLIDNGGHTAWRYSTTALIGDNGSGPTLTAATTAGWPGIYAPECGGATYSTFTFPAPLMNSAGDNAFISQLTTSAATTPPVTISPPETANYSGVWSGAPGDVHLRVRQNDLFPGSAPEDNQRIGAFASQLPYMSFNASGQLLTGCMVQGTIVSTSGSANNAALIQYTPGTGLTVIARRGDAAPGSPGEYYNGIGGASTPNVNSDMNNAGQLVFASSLRNAVTGGTQTTRWALFTNNSGTLTMAARGTSPMPAIANANGNEFVGVNWGEFSNYNLINHSGTILFDHSGMTGAVGANNTSAMFKLSPSGTFTKVMRQGDVAPAVSTTGGAVYFNGLQSSPLFNGLGQVAFSTLLSSTDGGVNGLTGNNVGIFVVDSRGTIYLVAQKATAFQVAPGDVRTVSSIGGMNASGGEDGRPTSLSENGVLMVTLGFTGGTSGVFAIRISECGTADFNCDGAIGTDADIESFFACLSGSCPPPPCTNTADFNGDGAVGTDADIESFFRVLSGGAC
jgi:hypothetical protein